MLLARSWRWRAILDYEMPSFPDTLRKLLTGSAEIVKVINHTELWDTELAWYSPSATRRICLTRLEHGFGIYNFSSTWLWLIIVVFDNLSEISWTICLLRFHLYCAWTWLWFIALSPLLRLNMALESTILALLDFDWSSWFLITWAKFLEPSVYCCMINCAFTFCTINIFGCFRGIIVQFELIKHVIDLDSIATFKSQCTTCQRTNYRDTSKHRRYLPITVWTASVMWYTSRKVVRTKYLLKSLLTLKYIYIYT